MRLKGKILALTLIPVISLGIFMFLVAADRIANGIYDEAYVSMEATTLAVRDIFEEVVSHVLKNGETYQNRNVEILGKRYIVCYYSGWTDCLCSPKEYGHSRRYIQWQTRY